MPETRKPVDEVVLEFENITKSYPGVRAVDDITLAVRRGEVHALVGENGAGKSTLMGIAAGVVRPDGGRVVIGGQMLDKTSPSDAAQRGLAIVYQHSSAISDLTVSENLWLAADNHGSANYSDSRRTVDRVLAESGLAIHPETRITSLSTAEKQLFEIAKALAFDAKVLILDEPTESLTQTESDHLFERIERISKEGTAVVYISHRLADVVRVSDRLTVLRDGRSRGTFGASELSQLEIIELMIGRSFNHTFPAKSELTEFMPVLEVERLSGTGFTDVSIAARQGEILGLAGVEGNGQRQFIRALAGLDYFSGNVTINGDPMPSGAVRRAQRRGVYYLPGDRHLEGLVLDTSVRENSTMLRLPQLATAGVISRRREREAAQSIVADFDVRTPSEEVLVSSLSGGNQQKVLLGRVVAPRPRVLLVEEPTRGVDVAARAEIYLKLRALANDGVAVVVLSSDAVELAGLCDRVAVFSRGEIADLLDGELTERRITSTALSSARDSREAAVEAAIPGATRSSGGSGFQIKGRTPLARFLSGDNLPSAVVAVLVVLTMISTQVQNERFLAPFNVFSILVLASVLMLASFGQTAVIMTGGIDLSVGPMIAFGIVILSYFGSEGGGSLGGIAVGVPLVLIAGLAVGAVNATLTRLVGLPSVLSTLIVGIILQGVALLLRPVPGGRIIEPLSEFKNLGFGVIPVVLIIGAGVGIALELMLRRSRWGLRLRATGADESRARTIGVPVERSHFSAYMLSSLLAAAAAVVLSSVVGIGDSAVGLTFTLLTITVAVVAGTSVFGGRGTFIGVVFAAILLQVLNSSVSFLQLGTAWQYWLPALLILAGAAAFSRIRQSQVVAV